MRPAVPLVAGARALIAPDAITWRVRPPARQLTNAWPPLFTVSDV